jgi:hypothetical protein
LGAGAGTRLQRIGGVVIGAVIAIGLIWLLVANVRIGAIVSPLVMVPSSLLMTRVAKPRARADG